MCVDPTAEGCPSSSKRSPSSPVSVLRRMSLAARGCSLSPVFGRTRGEIIEVGVYDLLPALAIVGITAFLTLTQPGSTSVRTYLGISAAVGLTVVGLALRRHFPLAVLTFLAVTYVFLDLTFFPTSAQEPFAVYLAILVVAYNTGSQTRGRRAAVGAVVLLLFIGAVAVQMLIQGRAGDAFLTLILMAAAWTIGRGLQRYRDLTSRLRAQAAQLARERDERAQLAVALERARIARELHDVIAHSVSVMVIQAAAERRVLEGEQDRTREVLEMIERSGRQALVELRRMLGVLRKTDSPDVLAPQPSLADLELLVTRVREAGLPVQMRLQGSPIALPPGIELSAYRIVQEALTNVLKHAGPASAEVTLRYSSDRLELEVTDDGRDGGADLSDHGHGLVGMRERVAMLGGSLRAGPKDPGGFSIVATLPLERPVP